MEFMLEYWKMTNKIFYMEIFMKKAILSIVLIFASMLTACGNSNEINSEEPLDLTGNWAQEGKEFENSYQAGYISGDRIEIFWMSDGGDSSALYWSGTYKAPQEATKEYSWDSINEYAAPNLASKPDRLCIKTAIVVRA